MQKQQYVITVGDRVVPLRKLTPRQIMRLDLLLEEVGQFGSLTLVVQKGQVKFVEVKVSKVL